MRSAPRARLSTEAGLLQLLFDVGLLECEVSKRHRAGSKRVLASTVESGMAVSTIKRADNPEEALRLASHAMELKSDLADALTFAAGRLCPCRSPGKPSQTSAKRSHSARMMQPSISRWSGPIA